MSTTDPIPSERQLRNHARNHADHDYAPRWVGKAEPRPVVCSVCAKEQAAATERNRLAKAARGETTPRRVVGPPTGALIWHTAAGSVLVTAPSPTHGLTVGQLAALTRQLCSEGVPNDALVLTRTGDGFQRATHLIIQPQQTRPEPTDQETAA